MTGDQYIGGSVYLIVGCDHRYRIVVRAPVTQHWLVDRRGRPRVWKSEAGAQAYLDSLPRTRV